MKGAAVEIARLEKALHLLSEIVRTFAEATTDLDRLLEVIAKKIAETLRDSCSLYLLDPDGVTLSVASRQHADPGAGEIPSLGKGAGALRLDEQRWFSRALDTGEAVLFAQVDAELVATQTTPFFQEVVRRLGIHSLLMAPLSVPGRRLGVMVMSRDKPTSPPFDEHDRALLQSLARHASVAIVNGRAFAEEQRAREALSEADRVFFEVSPVAMLVIDAETMRATAANRAALDLYGYSRPELLALPIESLRSRPDEDAVRAQVRTLVANGVDTKGLTLHRRKDGTEFFVEYVSRPTLFRGRTALLSVLVDVSDRVRAHETQARLASIVDSSEDAIVTKGLDGTINTWNRGAERIFGYTAAEIVGQPITMILPPEKLGEEMGIMIRIRRGERVDHYETVRVRKDGRPIDVSVTISPLYDGQGVLVGASKVARDITDRKRVEVQRREIAALDEENRRIQEASRLKSAFLANMSHELRTPLNAIIGFAELMHSGKTGALAADQQEYLGDILTSGRHLLELINGVLDLSKIEAGKIDLRPEPVDLGRIVGEVRDSLRPLATAKNIRIESEIDGSLGRPSVDSGKLKQILYNYLSNALKFTPDGGRVLIRIGAHDAESFRIDVEDSGIGIPAELQGKLFVEFEQLDSGIGKRYQGTGLGLALTKRLVEAQGGQVGVRSAPGLGSTFSATLPRTPKHAPAAPTGPTRKNVSLA